MQNCPNKERVRSPYTRRGRDTNYSKKTQVFESTQIRLVERKKPKRGAAKPSLQVGEETMRAWRALAVHSYTLHHSTNFGETASRPY